MPLITMSSRGEDPSTEVSLQGQSKCSAQLDDLNIYRMAAQNSCRFPFPSRAAYRLSVCPSGRATGRMHAGTDLAGEPRHPDLPPPPMAW